jgi:protein SCO1/2
VKRLDLEGQRLIIAHETIPDFMDAMTMPFRVKTVGEMMGIKVGDSLSFRLFVTEEESWIEQLRRVGTMSAAPERAVAVAVSPANVPAAQPKRHPLLDNVFTNEFGQPVTLAQYRGKALALTFFFTRCPIPDYCPRLSKNFEEASRKLREIPGAPTNWHFLSATFDTAVDTPAVLKAYGQRYGYDPSHWSFLTGEPDKIAELAKLSEAKFEYAGGFFNHNLRTLIIDPNGRLRVNIPVGGNLSDLIVDELLKAAAVPTQLSPP